MVPQKNFNVRSVSSLNNLLWIVPLVILLLDDQLTRSIIVDYHKITIIPFHGIF